MEPATSTQVIGSLQQIAKGIDAISASITTLVAAATLLAPIIINLVRQVRARDRTIVERDAALVTTVEGTERGFDAVRAEVRKLVGNDEAAEVIYKKTKGVLKAIVEGSESAEIVASIVNETIHGGARAKPHTQAGLKKVE